MDSFKCGLCHTTFHLLEDFVQHKQMHESRNESRLPSKLENGVEAVAISTKLTGFPQSSFPCYSPARSSSSCNSTSTCCPLSNCIPNMKYQSHSCISNIKMVYASNAESSAAVGSHEKALQLSNVHDTSSSMSSRAGRNDFKELSLQKGLSPPQVLDQIYKSSSKAVRYRIDSDGHLQKFSNGYKTDTNPAMSSSSRDISNSHLSLTNPKAHRNEEHLSITMKANEDCDSKINSEIVMDEERESSILIFESGNETVLMGQLILEDNSKDVVKIEITEGNGEIDRLVQPTTGVILTDLNVGVERRYEHPHIEVSLAESCLSYSALVNANNNDSMEQAVALTGSMAKKNTKNYSNEGSKNSANQNSLLINGCRTPHTPRFQSRKEIQESVDNINEEATQVDGISHRQFRSIHETYKTEVNANGSMDLRDENAKLRSSAKLPASPENENGNKTAKTTEELDASKGKDVGRWLNLDEDSMIIPQSAYDEGMELVATTNGISTNSEWNDTTYASTPGLYTLLLNADNTFTLVAGGYQGPSAGQSNRIFVCHLCKKFTQSQVEILNHISASHPEVLNDVNRCIGEFSLLPPSLVDNGDTSETSQVMMSVDVPVPTNGTNELLGNSSYQEDSFARSEPRRNIKKKLGRPRKEDQVCAEAQSQEPNVKRGFFKEGDGITCFNCHKYFVKYRQYDKHRCSVWKESLHQFEECNKAALIPGKDEGNDEREVGFRFSSIAEDDLEEEWKVNKRFKPKVKIKSGSDERRKRGRLPKVDVLASKAVVPDSSQNGKVELNNSHTTGHGNNNKDMPSRFVAEDIKSTVSLSHATVSSPPCLSSIPTLPVFSNSHQQERLQKWIAQTDLSFVDSIIDKLNPGEGDVNHETEMYRCQKCQVIFRSLLTCRRHCAKHMSRKAFTCPDCDFATANVGVLYNHYRIHTQNLYACSKCDFRARIKSHIRDHLETHYPSRYICRLCQKPYSTSNSLRSHIYLYHASNDGEKYLWSLRKKNQDRSSKDVFFQCPVCGKLFGERSSANRHLASHGFSIPRVQLKCEVCGTDLPSNDAFKKHMQKHKVVYMCCICNEPQVTANSLRNHQKGSSCQSLHQAESFKQSILLSFTSTNTFPSLLANKRIGPLLQDVKSYARKDPTYVKVNEGLFKQMQEIGYKQIFQLLQEREQPCLQVDVANNKRDVMKILVDTGSAEEVKQFIPWNKQQDAEEQVDCPYTDLVDQTIHHNPELATEGYRNHQKMAMFSEGRSNQGTISFDGNGSSATESPIYLRDRYPHTGESDQRVVVISNVGEEQTVVVEDGQVVLMEEEHFVIINDESDAKEPINFAKFFGDAD